MQRVVLFNKVPYVLALILNLLKQILLAMKNNSKFCQERYSCINVGLNSKIVSRFRCQQV